MEEGDFEKNDVSLRLGEWDLSGLMGISFHAELCGERLGLSRDSVIGCPRIPLAKL
jgi:hypothetical protein